MTLPSISIVNLMVWTFMNHEVLEDQNRSKHIHKIRRLTNARIYNSLSNIKGFNLVQVIYDEVIFPLVEKYRLSCSNIDIDCEHIHIIKEIFVSKDNVIKNSYEVALSYLKATKEVAATLTSINSDLDSEDEESLNQVSKMIQNLTIVCELMDSPIEIRQTTEELSDIIKECIRDNFYYQIIVCRQIQHPNDYLSTYEKYILEIYVEAFFKSLLKLMGSDIADFFEKNNFLKPNEAFTSLKCIEIITAKLLTKERIQFFFKFYFKIIPICANVFYEKTTQEPSEDSIFTSLKNFIHEEVKNKHLISLGIQLIFHDFFNTEIQNNCVLYKKSIYLLIIQNYFILDELILLSFEKNLDFIFILKIWNLILANQDKESKKNITILLSLIADYSLTNHGIVLNNIEISKLILGIILMFKIRSFFIQQSKSLDTPFNASSYTFNQDTWIDILLKPDDSLCDLLLSLFTNINLDPALNVFIKCFYNHEIKDLDVKFIIISKAISLDKQINIHFVNLYKSCFIDSKREPYITQFNNTEEIAVKQKNSVLITNFIICNYGTLFITSIYNKLTFSQLYSDSSFSKHSLSNFSLRQAESLTCYYTDSFLLQIISKSFVASLNEIMPEVLLKKPPTTEYIDYEEDDADYFHTEEEIEHISSIILEVYNNKHINAFFKNFTICLINNTHILVNILKIRPEVICKNLKLFNVFLEQITSIFLSDTSVILEVGDAFFIWLQQFSLRKSIELSITKKSPILIYCIHFMHSNFVFDKTMFVLEEFEQNELYKEQHIKLIDTVYFFILTQKTLLNSTRKELSKSLKRNRIKISAPSRLENLLASIIITSIMSVNIQNLSISFFTDGNQCLDFILFVSNIFTKFSEEAFIEIINVFKYFSKSELCLKIFTLVHDHIFNQYPETKKDLTIIFSIFPVKEATSLLQLALNLSDLFMVNFNIQKVEDIDYAILDDDNLDLQIQEAQEEPSFVSEQLQPDISVKSLTEEANKHLDTFKQKIEETFKDTFSEEDKSKLCIIQTELLYNIFQSIEKKHAPQMFVFKEYPTGAACFSDTREEFKLWEQQNKVTTIVDTNIKKHKEFNKILTSKTFDKWFEEQTKESKKRIKQKFETIKRFDVFENAKPLRNCYIQTYELRFNNPPLRIYYTKTSGCVYVLLGGEKQNQQKCIDLLNSKILPQHSCSVK